MSRWRPSVSEERWLALAARLAGQVPAEFLATRTGGWRRTGPLARLALAMLGLVAAACFVALLESGSDAAQIITGLFLIAAAEGLILGARLYASGIEEALETVGLLCIGYGAMSLGHGSASDASYTLLGAFAFGLAGLRLLNPLLTAAAAIALVAWVTDLPVAVALDGRYGHHLAFNALGALVVLAALAASARPIRRPAYEQMLAWLITALPVAGLIWSTGVDVVAQGRYSDAAGVPVVPALVVTVALMGAVLLVTGLRQRRHAPLLGFLVCSVHLGWLLRGVSGLSLEARLLLWGSVTLAVSVAIDRYLRMPRDGLTSEQMTDRQGALELLQLAGASALARAPAADGAAGPWSGAGGQSAGGGSSGSY